MSGSLTQVRSGQVREWACLVTVGDPWRTSQQNHTPLEDPPIPFPFFPWQRTVPSDIAGKNVVAVFDTGATNSCIASALARSIGLTSETSTDVISPDGQQRSPVYYASLWLPNEMGGFPFIPLLGFDDSGDEVLIGMDIIGQSSFLLSYDRAKDRSNLSFSIQPMV